MSNTARRQEKLSQRASLNVSGENISWDVLEQDIRKAGRTMSWWRWQEKATLVKKISFKPQEDPVRMAHLERTIRIRTLYASVNKKGHLASKVR